MRQAKQTSAPAARKTPTALAFERERRHSRRVRMLKVALPLSAALMVAGLVAHSAMTSFEGTSIDVSGVGIQDGELVMTHPKLDGYTKDDKPYSMSAARAVQDLSDAQKIELEDINAKLPLDNDGWAKINAATGTFDRGANTLDIDSPLTVRRHDGAVVHLQSAKVDIGSGQIESDKPVEIDMSGSRIAANSITVTDHGNVMTFKDRVRVTLTPDAAKAAATDGTADAGH